MAGVVRSHPADVDSVIFWMNTIMALFKIFSSEISTAPFEIMALFKYSPVKLAQRHLKLWHCLSIFQ
jgi:hypothetical protein